MDREMGGRQTPRQETTSAVTRPTPAPVRPTGTGSAGRRSSTRPRMKVPRSIDRDDDAAVADGSPELGAERQRAVGRGHGVLVEALTGGGLAAGFIAVRGGLSREGRARSSDEPTEALEFSQLLPARLGLAGVVVEWMAGGGAWIWRTLRRCCRRPGELRRSRRAPYATGLQFPAPHCLTFNMDSIPQIVLPHAWQVEPPSQLAGSPFGGLMRHERGSKSCYVSR